jgi:mannan endo-1,4-beta-mannosidase
MRKSQIGCTLLIGLLCINLSSLRGAEGAARPVTPNASPEAVELLNFIYRISGKETLSGQHNFPSDKDKNTLDAARAWGKTPAIFGKDWGFARAGDKDSAFVRNDIVEQLKEQYQKGSLVVMCWHEAAHRERTGHFPGAPRQRQ